MCKFDVKLNDMKVKKLANGTEVQMISCQKSNIEKFEMEMPCSGTIPIRDIGSSNEVRYHNCR